MERSGAPALSFRASEASRGIRTGRRCRSLDVALRAPLGMTAGRGANPAPSVRSQFKSAFRRWTGDRSVLKLYGAPAIRCGVATPGGVRRSRRIGGTVTPPETMNAMTSALSASRGVTALAGKIMSWPAKLYDCGM